MNKFKNLSALAVIISFALFTVIIPGCGEDSDDDAKTTEPPPPTCRELLADNLFIEAYDCFDAMPQSDENDFAKAIARTGELTQSIQTLLGLALMVVSDLPIRGDIPTLGYQDENEFIAGLIDEVLYIFIGPSREIMTLLDGIKDNQSLTFTIDEFNLSVLGFSTVRLGGEWDHADILALQAGVGMLGGLFHIITTYGLRFDLYQAYADAAELIDADQLNTKSVFNLLAKILTDEAYPNFLGLSETDIDGNGVSAGEENMPLAAQFFATALAAAAALPGAIEAESDDQSDDILVITNDAPGFAETGFGLEKRLVLSDEGKFILLTEGVFKDFSLGLTEAGISDLNLIAENLSANDASRTPVPLKSVLLPIVELALSLLPYIDLGTLSDYLDPIKGFLNNSEGLTGVALGFIPADIELDPGTCLNHPVGLRDLAPYIRTDLDRDKMSFILEYECLARMPAGAEIGSVDYMPDGSIMCPKPEDYPEEPADSFYPVDATHFTAGFYDGLGVDSIPPDNVASRIPIIAMPDASLGGLLLIDAADFEIVGAQTGMLPANNLTFNALIAHTVDSFPF